MLLTYSECIQEYGSKYNLNKKIKTEELFQLEKGIYSDKKYVSEIQIISKKYPEAIFTLNSAFYYHQLTDTIPDKYYLATSRGASKIVDSRVVQIFDNSNGLKLGAEHIEYNGTSIYMYNKERMLIELLRNKNKLSFDYYKEILNNYRNIIDSLDIQLIQDLAIESPKSRMIMEALQLEVF